MKYIPTIGLEIHAELRTKTKMFCGCANNADEDRPNVNVCPICMGHPGTLPVVNREAVFQVLRLGTAVGGIIADFTEFDRKNYFYPDIPKGYQISQYKYPLISGGVLASVALTRVHLEEDTASSGHEEGEYSLVDFNRAGRPLMELVTEPVIHDAETAVQFAKELQLLLRYLGAGDANMEKGEMRVEANISISSDPHRFGTKVEVKNLNSFRAVERAIKYELNRHEALLESGGVVAQETRGWDDGAGKTYTQRRKENSHDYRYFPDPDIPKFELSAIPEFTPQAIEKTLPELPWQKRKRYASEYGLKAEDVEVFVSDHFIATFFEEVVSIPTRSPEMVKLASNYIVSDLLGLMRSDKRNSIDTPISSESRFLKIKPSDFGTLMSMIVAGTLSSRGAKDVLRVLYEKGGDPETIAKELGVIQKSGSADLLAIAQAVVADNPTVVAEYRLGKQASLQYLIGQGMRLSKGSANPSVLKETLVKILQ
jgi:aspartyl-tRNA(Asn)/glutamyl-tRNA(Gln) amidotransferase subunit B